LVSTPYYTPLASDIFNVYIIVLPTSIKVNGVAQDIDIKTSGGFAVHTSDQKGYSFNKSVGWANSYSYFKVNLGTGNKLSDYTKITFKITGSGDDYRWKNGGIVVSDTEFSGMIISASEESQLKSPLYNGYDSAVNNIEITIPTNVITPGSNTANSSTPWISIYIHTPSGQEYIITDIEFIK